MPEGVHGGESSRSFGLRSSAQVQAPVADASPCRRRQRPCECRRWAVGRPAGALACPRGRLPGEAGAVPGGFPGAGGLRFHRGRGSRRRGQASPSGSRQERPAVRVGRPWWRRDRRGEVSRHDAASMFGKTLQAFHGVGELAGSPGRLCGNAVLRGEARRMGPAGEPVRRCRPAVGRQPRLGLPPLPVGPASVPTVRVSAPESGHLVIKSDALSTLVVCGTVNLKACAGNGPTTVNRY